MAKHIHVHFHDFNGAGFRTRQKLRAAVKDSITITWNELQRKFKSGDWEAMSDLRRHGSWGTQWVKRTVRGERQPAQEVRVENIPEGIKDCACKGTKDAPDPNRITSVYGTSYMGKRVMAVRTQNGKQYIVYPSETNGEMPRVGSILDPNKHGPYPGGANDAAEIIKGTGPNAGEWGVRERGVTRWFGSEAKAREYMRFHAEDVEATPGGYVFETLSDGVIREQLAGGGSYEEMERKARALAKKHDDTIVVMQRGKKVGTYTP